MTPVIADKKIVLFDGVCNLCNASVQFILRQDQQEQFLFGSLQGNAGQAYLKQYQLPASTFNSFMLVEGDRLYIKSGAALRMLKHLGGAWSLLYGFIIVPRPLRDAVYNFIARKRYAWFGKRDA
ncbi:MAG TPA: DCC1-like thiol-disulfide oxidoreductase family protein, partial [Chitinophagaceae bacterium]|nr:DCC1-like thiol-disulfide oxidoreductase family protein [Chitinophagaceae bacterium]